MVNCLTAETPSPAAQIHALDLAVALHAWTSLTPSFAFLDSLSFSRQHSPPSPSSPITLLQYDVLHLIRSQLLSDALSTAEEDFTCAHLVCEQCVASRKWVEWKEGPRFKEWREQVMWVREKGECRFCREKVEGFLQAVEGGKKNDDLSSFLSRSGLDAHPVLPSSSPPPSFSFDPFSLVLLFAASATETSFSPELSSCARLSEDRISSNCYQTNIPPDLFDFSPSSTFRLRRFLRTFRLREVNEDGTKIVAEGADAVGGAPQGGKEEAGDLLNS
ncbi:hypothetical protein JCM8547_001952 [Rhodosporidiobolus lusitaniae]